MQHEGPGGKKIQGKSRLSPELTEWEEMLLSQEEKMISSLESEFEKPDCEEANFHEQLAILKDIKNRFKSQIASTEKEIDEISLNTPHSSKLQISVPSNLNYLMRVWAAAEGRDLASVALQCLEFGLREMQSRGTIPSRAIEKYEIACEKRILLAEISGRWDRKVKSLTVNSLG